MSGIGDDYHAESGAIDRAHARLSQLDPENELLRYVESKDGGLEFVSEAWGDFFDRYSKGEERLPTIHLWARYRLELQAEVRRLERDRS